MPVPALIAAGAAIAGGAVQQSAANKNSNEAREHNLKLAQLQNKWSIDQWHRENEYNSPAAMLRRGLNPDLVYGGGASATAAASPSMTSGAPSQPTDTQGLANASAGVQQATQMAMQTRLLKAQAENLEADAQGKQIDNETKGEMNQALLNEKNISILGTEESTKLTAAQREKLSSDVKLIDTQIEKLNAEIGNIGFNQAMARADLAIRSALSDKQLGQLTAQTDLTNAQTRQIVEMLPALVAAEWAKTHNLDVNTTLTKEATTHEPLKRALTAAQTLGIKYSNEGQLLINDITKVNADATWKVDNYTGGFIPFLGEFVKRVIPFFNK